MENERKQSNNAGQIENFLETILKSHGERSMLYVSQFLNMKDVRHFYAQNFLIDFI